MHVERDARGAVLLREVVAPQSLAPMEPPQRLVEEAGPPEIEMEIREVGERRRAAAEAPHEADIAGEARAVAVAGRQRPMEVGIAGRREMDDAARVDPRRPPRAAHRRS